MCVMVVFEGVFLGSSRLRLGVFFVGFFVVFGFVFFMY